MVMVMVVGLKAGRGGNVVASADTAEPRGRTTVVGGLEYGYDRKR